MCISYSKLKLLHCNTCIYSKKRQNGVVPSRSQLRWTSKDNVNSIRKGPITKSQVPILPRALRGGRPHTKQPASRSKFTWRRTSSGKAIHDNSMPLLMQLVGTTPRRRSSSSSSLSSHITNRKFKMVSITMFFVVNDIRHF